MTSPVPGLRLLDESRTRDGQGEDLNEDDVWDVAGDGDEEDEDDVLPFPDRSERDSDVEPSDVDDELTAEDDDVSGRTDAVAASPAASSLPRAIASSSSCGNVSCIGCAVTGATASRGTGGDAGASKTRSAPSVSSGPSRRTTKARDTSSR